MADRTYADVVAGQGRDEPAEQNLEAKEHMEQVLPKIDADDQLTTKTPTVDRDLEPQYSVLK